MMSMDIRKIDVNYRRTAAVVLFVLAVALVCAMVYLWQEGANDQIPSPRGKTCID